MGSRNGDSPSQALLKDSLAAKELQTMEKHLAGKYYGTKVTEFACRTDAENRFPINIEW